MWGSGSTERLSPVSEVMQLSSGRAGMWNQVVWLSSPCCQHGAILPGGPLANTCQIQNAFLLGSSNTLAGIFSTADLYMWETVRVQGCSLQPSLQEKTKPLFGADELDYCTTMQVEYGTAVKRRKFQWTDGRALRFIVKCKKQGEWGG